ncbi:MAG TPA: phage portal protein [Phycisphaerae bacterium]|nr:phage portal protein [Phycisphaerae bacterium]
MAFELKEFQDSTLDAEFVAYMIDGQAPENELFYNRLWNYFRNPIIPLCGVSAATMNENSRPYFLAQEMGLPARITGIIRNASGDAPTDLRRKEVVIENDIAWRISCMVDFLFGRPINIRSSAEEPTQAAEIEKIISTLFSANGGAAFFQELALFGAVYGFVDIALRIPADWPAEPISALRTFNPKTAGKNAAELHESPDAHSAAGRPGISLQNHSAQDTANVEDRSEQLNAALDWVRKITLETVEASRVLPVLAEDDYRTIRYWVQRYFKAIPRLATSRRGFMGLLGGRSKVQRPEMAEVVEIIGDNWWQRYEDRMLVAHGPNLLSRVPVVHLQNIASPGTYGGLSDVEPMIPLQDELNTRLSDRANRVTYQSFKMYLGKGIDDFLERPVGPGQMWATQNLNASIEEFGNDEGSPSEDIHIDQVRQAMDKVSGVAPLAAGLLSGKVGNLTSATALKVVLSGLISRTNRKRLTYGKAITDIIAMTLEWLDKTGVYRTTPQQRKVELHWPSPLPNDETQLLQDAKLKLELGVPAERVLAELGY